MTITPNELVATVHPSRMPVMLVGEEAHDRWLEGSTDDALGLVQSYPAEQMTIVQAGTEISDTGRWAGLTRAVGRRAFACTPKIALKNADPNIYARSVGQKRPVVSIRSAPN